MSLLIRDKLTIINYHRVLEKPDSLYQKDITADQFERQIKLLSNFCNLQPLSVAIKQLYSGCLEPRTVAITFDDGYKSCYSLAKPILESYNVSATFFIVTSLIAKSGMWNDVITQAIRYQDDFPLHKFGLSVPSFKEDHEKCDYLINKIKYLPLDQRNEIIHTIKTLRPEIRYPKFLNESEIVELAKHHEVGGHTHTHPILSLINENTAISEIQESKFILEDITRQKIINFAYPNGKYNKDFGDIHTEILKEVGFGYGFTSDWGVASIKTNKFLIPRISLPNNASAIKVLRKLILI
jgi:peptidoglycan/xylan/chitin deacetylase (PgdA/CDA1 family)